MGYTDPRGGNAAKTVRCPFYKRKHKFAGLAERNKMRANAEIICEGIAKTSKETALIFSSDKRYEQFYYDFCCGDYTACPVAKGCTKKYE